MTENIPPREGQEAKIDLMSEEGVVHHMLAATSESDWNNRCDEVKAANGNNYPEFWFAKVIVGGVASIASAKW